MQVVTSLDKYENKTGKNVTGMNVASMTRDYTFVRGVCHTKKVLKHNRKNMLAQMNQIEYDFKISNPQDKGSYPKPKERMESG